MIPPDKSVSDFAFQHEDIVESGPSLTEATLKQRNASDIPSGPGLILWVDDKTLFNSHMSKSQLYSKDCRHLKLIGVRSERFLVTWNAGLYESELDTLANFWPITLATSKGDEYKAVYVSNIGTGHVSADEDEVDVFRLLPGAASEAEMGSGNRDSIYLVSFIEEMRKARGLSEW
ncbi:hypothetical protein TNCV_2050321 [Trichonephila clavipes]|nr:hypothetical protein TNCV_2050321 [Trichonephila clavipes]